MGSCVTSRYFRSHDNYNYKIFPISCKFLLGFLRLARSDWWGFLGEAMLALRDNTLGRRSFLRIGGLSLGGLSLADILSARADGGSLATGKSVVFLFMHGGPPQTETFDPKMDAPDGVRSVNGEVRTSIPGVTFGAGFPKIAKLAKDVSIVRSFTTGNGNHDIKPIVGTATAKANMGSLYSRIAGLNCEETGMPTNLALFPRAVLPDTQPANNKFGKFASTGPLGSAYAPFMPGAGGDAQEDMMLHLSRQRLDDRRYLLGQIDQWKRGVDKSQTYEGMNRFQQQAFDVVMGGVGDAFDLSKEDPRTLARYDTGSLYDVSKISKKWNNHKNYADHARSLGRLMLLARRLCERGAGFVTVTTNFVWDFHADKNNATVDEGFGYVGTPFDHAVSAFIEDVKARGLSEKILLVACGEMGRNPKVNAKGGRDHWGKLAPLLLSGGGLRMGQVIGKSSRDAGEPADRPVTNANLVSTIMHTVLDIPKLRTVSGIPAEIGRVITGSEPISELF